MNVAPQIRGDAEEDEGGFSPLGDEDGRFCDLSTIHALPRGSRVMRVVVFEVRQSIPSKGAHVPFEPWGNHERERTWCGSIPLILARLLKADKP